VKFFATAFCGVPGPDGGFSGFSNTLGENVLVHPSESELSFGACGPGQQLIAVGGFWDAERSQLSRTSGLALNSFTSLDPEFDVEGANMSNRNFGLVANGRCGT
jgi:hypothetical protein